MPGFDEVQWSGELPPHGSSDAILLDRALRILHHMATECSNDGWWHRLFCRRWYYSDEPLRNDAANLVREVGFGMAMPDGTRLVGDPH
jgi:hypothetical protein